MPAKKKASKQAKKGQKEVEEEDEQISSKKETKSSGFAALQAEVEEEPEKEPEEEPSSKSQKPNGKKWNSSPSIEDEENLEEQEEKTTPNKQNKSQKNNSKQTKAKAKSSGFSALASVENGEEDEMDKQNEEDEEDEKPQTKSKAQKKQESKAKKTAKLEEEEENRKEDKGSKKQSKSQAKSASNNKSKSRTPDEEGEDGDKEPEEEEKVSKKDAKSPKPKQSSSKPKSSGFAALAMEDEDGDKEPEEEEKPISKQELKVKSPKSKPSPSNKSKSSGFAAFAMQDEDEKEEEAEEEEKPVSKKEVKSGKQKLSSSNSKSSGFAALAVEEEEPEEEEEEEEEKTTKKQSKSAKQKQSSNKTKLTGNDDLEERESVKNKSSPKEEPKPTSKKQMKSPKSKPQAEEVEEEEEEEAKKPTSKKQAKASTSSKKSGFAALADMEEEEEEKQEEEEQEEQQEEDEEEKPQKTKEQLKLERMKQDKERQQAAKREKEKKKKMKGKEEISTDEKPAEEEVKEFLVEEERKGSSSMSKDIKVERFDISYPKKTLFKDATLTLAHGRKYGLVAPNGSGKSTLLDHIARRTGPFIAIPAHFDIHYVEQEVTGDNTLAIDSVIAADTNRARLLAEEKRLLNSEDPDAGDKLVEIHAKLDEIESYTAEARASSILSGLQFTEEMKKQATNDFSGGWRMRISLARALFKRPTLLLLDEPTNHLDLFAVIWLETYLRKWKNTLLVVSHDQDFLNSICTDVIHIYQEKLVYYKGNYDVFKKSFNESVANQRKAYEKQKKLLKEAQIQKSKKQNAKKEVEKAKDRVKVLRSKQLKAQKIAEQEAFQDAHPADLIVQPDKDYNVVFEFPEPDQLSIPVIQVNDASFGYSPDKLLFKDLNFGIDLESRIALVGPNGTGKSTLIKLLTGELEATSGMIQRNRKLTVGKFTQHFVDKLNMDQTPVEYLSSQFPDFKPEQLRSMLGRFGLTGQTHLRAISSLSGGQKSRVVFTEICMRHPHILFLDEPTNHLDIESVDALSDALNEFKGGLVLVSHDSRLIGGVCSDIWICGNNTVTIYDGDFDDYRQELVEEFEEKERAEEERRKEREDERKKKREEEMRQRQEKINNKSNSTLKKSSAVDNNTLAVL